MDREAWKATVHAKELDTTEQVTHILCYIWLEPEVFEPGNFLKSLSLCSYHKCNKRMLFG